MSGLILEEFGVDVGAEFFAEAGALIAAEFDRSLAAVPGIADALTGLDRARCLASSSDPARISHSLGLTGLIGFFEPHLVFSATMVERGKPAPDLFLYAAAECAVLPDVCVVIEDSVPGVTAAVPAGMRVIGFAGGGHCGPRHAGRLDEAGADVVVHHGSDLLAAL
ncbi:MAG: HAD superfamily hydrolase (TIGR01509 family) [Candidatus Poriferisodalaceae bacterium]|jgi:HAD superfamily hydrolase (TIGR01509 family)